MIKLFWMERLNYLPKCYLKKKKARSEQSWTEDSGGFTNLKTLICSHQTKNKKPNTGG